MSTDTRLCKAQTGLTGFPSEIAAHRTFSRARSSSRGNRAFDLKQIATESLFIKFIGPKMEKGGHFENMLIGPLRLGRFWPILDMM